MKVKLATGNNFKVEFANLKIDLKFKIGEALFINGADLKLEPNKYIRVADNVIFTTIKIFCFYNII